QLVRVPGQTPQHDGLLFEQREQPPADVPGSARQQHDGEISTSRLRWRHRVRCDLGWERGCFADSMLRGHFTVREIAAQARLLAGSNVGMLSLRKPSADALR